MMSLFQTPPTVHFALLDGTPNNIKGAWSKVCGNKFQWAPSDDTIPQVIIIIISLSNTCNIYFPIHVFMPYNYGVYGIEIVDMKFYISDGSYQIGLQ